MQAKRLTKHRKPKTALAVRLTALRKSFGPKYTQEKLAGILGVKPSTVSVWEGATEDRDYQPAAAALLRFADLAARFGGSHDDDCLWLLKQAGVTPDALQADNRARGWGDPRPSNPGEVVALPLMDPECWPVLEMSANQSVDLPSKLIREPRSVICVRTGAGVGPPFDLNALVVIDQSKTHLESLLDERLPVAIHYSRASNLQIFPGPPVHFPFVPAGAGAISVNLMADELPEGFGVTTDEYFDRDSEYRRDPERKWDRPGIRVGWLSRGVLWRSGDLPLQSVFLWSPIVPNRWGGSALQVTKWHPVAPAEASQPPQWDLFNEGLRVLGQVVLWVPSWAQPIEDTRPKQKSRKEKK